MPLAVLLPLIGSMLTQAVGMFAGDDDKLGRIAEIGAGALNRIPGMIEGVKNLFDGDPDRVLTTADFDGLIAKIAANSSKIDQLTQAAHDREA